MNILKDISEEDFINQYQHTYAWYDGILAFIGDVYSKSKFEIKFLEDNTIRLPTTSDYNKISIKKPKPRWVPSNEDFFYVIYSAPRSRVCGLNSGDFRIYPTPMTVDTLSRVIIKFLCEKPFVTVKPISWTSLLERSKGQGNLLISSQLLLSDGYVFRGATMLYPHAPMYEPYLRTFIPDLPRTA